MSQRNRTEQQAPRGATRRRFLAGAAGCSIFASPALTPLALAETASDARLVVILLRGGMDGLDVIRPLGDPGFAALRPTLGAGPKGGAGAGTEEGPRFDLGAGFALHPALAPLWPLWQAGQFGAVHAVSTPYRDQRSHFEGQDLLEAGLSGLEAPDALASGWLNRLLPHLAGTGLRTGFAVEREGTIILRGPAPAAQWYPQGPPDLSPQSERLLRWIYAQDPLFHSAAEQAFALIAEQDPDLLSAGLPAHLRVAEYVAAQLRGATRLASFSINGWDTHGAQARALRRPLSQLAETILHLRSALGPAIWDRTAILAMTEFGRSAAENGTGGTDHGTGGAMLFAGGAVRGGQVLGRWPGLEEAALYDRRDLMPTADLRGFAAQAIQGLFGTEAAALERDVFPGLDMGTAAPLIL